MAWKYRKLISNLGNVFQALVARNGDWRPLVAEAEAEARRVLDAAGIAYTSEEEESSARAAGFTMKPVPGVPEFARRIDLAVADPRHRQHRDRLSQRRDRQDRPRRSVSKLRSTPGWPTSRGRPRPAAPSPAISAPTSLPRSSAPDRSVDERLHAVGQGGLDEARGTGDRGRGDQIVLGQLTPGGALGADPIRPPVRTVSTSSATGVACGRARSGCRPGTANQTASPVSHTVTEAPAAMPMAATVQAWLARSAASAPQVILMISDRAEIGVT